MKCYNQLAFKNKVVLCDFESRKLNRKSDANGAGHWESSSAGASAPWKNKSHPYAFPTWRPASPILIPRVPILQLLSVRLCVRKERHFLHSVTSVGRTQQYDGLIFSYFSIKTFKKKIHIKRIMYFYHSSLMPRTLNLEQALNILFLFLWFGISQQQLYTVYKLCI